jgi:hypothetical protein
MMRLSTRLLWRCPAQIHLDQFHLPLTAEPPQFRPGTGHQLIALSNHAVECRGNEDGDAAVVIHISKPESIE